MKIIVLYFICIYQLKFPKLNLLGFQFRKFLMMSVLVCAIRLKKTMCPSS